MIVSELIEELEKCPRDDEIAFQITPDKRLDLLIGEGVSILIPQPEWAKKEVGLEP